MAGKATSAKAEPKAPAGARSGATGGAQAGPAEGGWRTLLQVYAPDKARTTRWILGVCGFALVAYGAYGLFYAFGEAMRAPIGGWKPLGDEFTISWAFVLSVLWLIAGSGGVWYGVNHPRLVEFFYETELELGRVSWASKNEVIGSSVIVLVVTAVLAAWIGLLDRAMLALLTTLGY